jgi:two-component system, LytTR family, sensor kinase
VVDLETGVPLSERSKLGVRGWLLIIGIWTLLALLAATSNIAYRAHNDIPAPAAPIFGRAFLDWYTCAVFTPAIFWVARRFPLDGRTWRRNAFVHLLAMGTYITLKLLLFVPPARALGWVRRNETFGNLFLGDAFPLLIAYWGVVGAAHGIAFYQRYRDRELRASQLEARLAQVQLDALRAQIHPHFLFNSLNALSTLMHRDVGAADRMVLQLGELLRYTLDNAAPQEVTLAQELQFVERYLAIMKIRLGDRLSVHMEVAPDVQKAFVPNLVLQPLVENALRHGIGRSASAGELTVRAYRSADSLQLEVQDDGPGLPAAGVKHGVGLSNTALRLRQLYGAEQHMSVRNCDGRGTIVVLRIPFHEAPLEQKTELVPA